LRANRVLVGVVGGDDGRHVGTRIDSHCAVVRQRLRRRSTRLRASGSGIIGSSNRRGSRLARLLSRCEGEQGCGEEEQDEVKNRGRKEGHAGGRWRRHGRRRDEWLMPSFRPIAVRPGPGGVF
jgi:hypothetical protein